MHMGNLLDRMWVVGLILPQDATYFSSGLLISIPPHKLNIEL